MLTCVGAHASPSIAPHKVSTLHTLSRDDAVEATALVVQPRAGPRDSSLR